MEVLLIRHGEAVDTQTAETDHDRWLTDSGRRTVAAVGNELTKLALRYTAIYTSPLVRSVQTAEILAGTQPGFRGSLEVHPGLASETGTIAQALEPLEHAGDEDLIVMVTHMPKVSALAAQLGQLSSAPSFRTASTCLLRVGGGKGRLQWMLDPQTLERRHA
jgi:phosphohistidine phosphatase SixA